MDLGFRVIGLQGLGFRSSYGVVQYMNAAMLRKLELALIKTGLGSSRCIVEPACMQPWALSINWTLSNFA